MLGDLISDIVMFIMGVVAFLLVAVFTLLLMFSHNALLILVGVVFACLLVLLAKAIIELVSDIIHGIW